MMLKIADLLTEIGQACEMQNISGPCLRVLSDANFLVMKGSVNPEGWRDSYRNVFGSYPTRNLLEKNADDAIRSAKELQAFGRTVNHLMPEASVAADELVRRLQEYRDFLPPYF